MGIASAQIDAGTSIAFTGQGFTPGEQVVATLDNGLVSVGPLAAGAQGEVAGVLPVPYEVRGGTHVVTLTGAASNGIAQAEVTINPAAVTLDSAAAAEQMPAWLFVVLVTAILLALALIAVSLTMSILRGAKRRREQKAQAAALAEAQAEPQKQGADGFDSAGAIPSMWPTTFPPANDAPTIELPSVTTGSRS